MDKPTIIMLIPELTMGGAQNSFARLAWALSLDYTIIPVVFDSGTKPFYQMPAEVMNLGTKPAQNFFSKIKNFTARYRTLKKLKKQIQPIACISFLEGADYLNVLTRAKERIILSIRGSKWYDPNMRSYLFVLRTKVLIPLIYRGADRIVTVNKGIQQELVNYFKLDTNKIETIYNYIDIVNDPLPQISTLPNSPYVLYSGRLAHEKGIKGIINVFASSLSEIPELKLVLLGEGPERDNIIRHAKAFQLTIGNETHNQIILAGSVSNTYPYIQNANVIVLNSVSEGFPNAMAESLLIGKLVVAGDCPYGPRELFTLGEGKDIDNNTYPIETGGGTLLPPIDEPFISLWVNAICKIVKEKKDSDELFVSRFKERTSKEKFIINWKRVLKD